MDRPPLRPHQLAGPAISLADIYYIIFRHKWKIVSIVGVGFTAAIFLPLIWKLPYQSEAKLFIRYVLETKSPGQIGANDSRVKSPDERGENIINTELEILTSLDLAQEVADVVGPQKILAKAGGGNDKYAAAIVIHRNVTVEVPKKSDVIRIVFQHPDPDIVQPVLNQLIETYLKKHAEIHRSVGVFDDFLTQETDQLRSRLVQTEDELRKAKAKVGVLSLDDSKKVFTEQTSKIQQAIFDAEADLAERQASVAELARLLHTPVPASISIPTSTNAQTGTNPALAALTLAPPPAILRARSESNGLVANVPAPTNDLSSPAPPDKVAEYRRVCGILEGLQKRQEELLNQFTPGSSMVKPTEERITENEKLKNQLEEQFPALLALPVAQPKTAETAAVSNPRLDLTAEIAKVSALEAKIKVLTNELANIRTNATAIDMAEGSITELQRKKELEEAHYKYFAANLEQSRIDEALGAGRVSNISKIQAPSPPFKDTAKLQKIRGAALFGSIAFAFALAFFIELYLDRSLKRATEVEAKLGLPLFISIPLLNGNGNGNGNGKHRLLNGKKKLPLLLPSSRRGSEAEEAGSTLNAADSSLDPSLRQSNATADPSSIASAEEDQPPVLHSLGGGGSTIDTADSTPTPADSGLNHASRITHQAPLNYQPSTCPSAFPSTINHQPSTLNQALRPFSEALRDRLITFFEIKNLTHKPKLVAVTSCASGSGVTSVATNLAASLSETGDGNVLLVDMNHENGATHDFHDGKLTCGLDDALEVKKRGDAMVQDNLYLVRESGNGNGASGHNGHKISRVLPKRFNQLMPRLRASDYDYIIFDMPAINQISVTPRLARFMDMVLLVVESEKTDRDAAKRALSLIADPKPNLGVVLNKSRVYLPKRLRQDV